MSSPVVQAPQLQAGLSALHPPACRRLWGCQLVLCERPQCHHASGLVFLASALHGEDMAAGLLSVVDVEGRGGPGILWVSRAVEGTRELCQGIEGTSEESGGLAGDI